MIMQNFICAIHHFVIIHLRCCHLYPLIFCNHSASYDNFDILTHENKKFLLELNEGLLKMGDKPYL